jgi:hypothetical protein
MVPLYGGDVVSAQYTKWANEQDERDDKANDIDDTQKWQKSTSEKENLRAPFTSASQDMDQPPLMGQFF